MKIKSLIILSLGFCVILTSANAKATPPKLNNDADTSISFVVNNKTNKNFAHVIIVPPGNNGTMKYDIKCVASALGCSFGNIIVRQKIGKFWTFKFLGDDRKIVGGYVLYRPEYGKNPIELTDITLGSYVSYQIIKYEKKYKNNEEDLFYKLKEIEREDPSIKSCQHSSNGAANEEELGLYFKCKVVNGVLSERKFYEKFNSI